MRIFVLAFALLCFFSSLAEVHAFFGLFGEKKKEPVEDQRLEEMQQRNFEFKTKGDFKAKTISPSSLSRNGGGGVNWNRKWDKKNADYTNRKALSDHYRKEVSGMNKQVRGLNMQWIDADNRDTGSFDKRFRDEKQINPWDERRIALDHNQSAARYDRELPMKEYKGRELAKIKRDMRELDSILSATKDLPDRPLTVAEVREILNRGRVKESTREEADSAVRRALPAR